MSKEEEQRANQGNHTFGEEKNQFDSSSLHESKAHSIISHTNDVQSLLRLFQEYSAASQMIDLEALHKSDKLKLKKYKESVYYGEFMNGKRHGKGIMIYDNQRTYEGDWECDYKHGQGYEKFSNECFYQGDYVNGKPEGVGRYTWPNGEFYEGEWLNGMKSGSGMWRGAKGDSYLGEWKFGKADGYGVHVWINGDRYEGEFKQCLKHGEGIEKFANEDIYKGLYANGKPHGYGEYYWANGSYFKGSFKNGLRDGQGVWKRGPGDSDKYEGEYENDKKNGYGIFAWATGNIYKGHYEADARNGYGEMYWKDGSYYKGEWRKGIQHGRGQIYVVGEGYKKGMFQDNILVIVQQERESDDTHEQIPDPQKFLQRSLSKKKSIPSKVSFRSRGLSYSSKNKKGVYPSLNDASIIQYNGKQDNVLLSKKFRKKKQDQYVTLGYRSEKQGKQRILHSSFYMHKLNNRATTSINASRAQTHFTHPYQQNNRMKLRGR